MRRLCDTVVGSIAAADVLVDVVRFDDEDDVDGELLRYSLHRRFSIRTTSNSDILGDLNRRPRIN